MKKTSLALSLLSALSGLAAAQAGSGRIEQVLVSSGNPILEQTLDSRHAS